LWGACGEVLWMSGDGWDELIRMWSGRQARGGDF
jgi:hypothetical protein